MTRFVISAAVLALALAASGAASAQDQTMRVRIGDLNVHSDAGATAALARIRTAAASFCGGDGSRDLGAIAQQRACVSRMTWTAVSALHAPRVTALSGHSAPVVLAAAPR
jgi:UrcA family protein